MRDYFEPPPCKACKGRGYHLTECVTPMTCEVCGGDGRKWNMLVTLGTLLFVVVTTVGPIWWFC
jgi:DnaJ-class molecular chaperone